MEIQTRTSLMPAQQAPPEATMQLAGVNQRRAISAGKVLVSNEIALLEYLLIPQYMMSFLIMVYIVLHCPGLFLIYHFVCYCPEILHFLVFLQGFGLY